MDSTCCYVHLRGCHHRPVADFDLQSDPKWIRQECAGLVNRRPICHDGVANFLLGYHPSYGALYEAFLAEAYNQASLQLIRKKGGAILALRGTRTHHP